MMLMLMMDAYLPFRLQKVRGFKNLEPFSVVNPLLILLVFLYGISGRALLQFHTL